MVLSGRAFGHARKALRLVEQVAEFRPGALEGGGVDVRDVVGDNFQMVCDWAFMPVAAMVRARHRYVSSDRHAADFLIGGDQLVADAIAVCSVSCAFITACDDLLHRGLALDARDRRRFALLQRVHGVGRDLGKHLAEIRRRAGRCDGAAPVALPPTPRAERGRRRRQRGMAGIMMQLFNRSMVMVIEIARCLTTCRLAS